ncbi:MAG: hypothetical protein EA413_13250 [Cyanobium sp. PLM2.Bin73]|nr:MAG: hypothetical protein EA413_13250 [Cyanobium sp. PLM2.Bin73]
MHSSFDQLCAAVADDIGMPVGRVRRVALALERQRLRAASAAPGSDPLAAPAGAPQGSAAQDDPLRWYPLGANGRLRPPLPERP